MNNSTALIAIVVLIGIFGLMAISLFLYGVDGATRVWGLLGVAFGAIISFYFTNKAQEGELSAIRTQATVQVQQANSAAARQVEQLKADSDAAISKAFSLKDKNPAEISEAFRDLETQKNNLTKNFDLTISRFQAEAKEKQM